MKTAISIPDQIFEAAEQLARRLNIEPGYHRPLVIVKSDDFNRIFLHLKEDKRYFSRYSSISRANHFLAKEVTISCLALPGHVIRAFYP